MRVYFDNAATTPLDPRVIESMTEVMQTVYGNPSSIHAEGRKAKTLVEQARRHVAQILGASIGEIFFTSGGTESNNMIMTGCVRDLGVTRIITSPIEHHCVLHVAQHLASDIQVDFVKIHPDGQPDMEDLARLLSATDVPVGVDHSAGKTLVSLMHGNNEIGTMIDLTSVGSLCNEHNALFHSDTVQSVGKYPMALEETPVDFITGSAHKFFGPKGVGFAYISADAQIKPYLLGGAQERNMRAGTENVSGIVGLSTALKLISAEAEERKEHTQGLKSAMYAGLKEILPSIELNGSETNSLSHILSCNFPPSPEAELLILNLDIAGISASGGSACSSGVEAGSHVLNALYPDSEKRTVRFSFSHLNTMEEVELVLEKVRDVLGG